MAVLANRPFELAPGWAFGSGQRFPADLWNGLGKGKQKALLAGRFVIQKEGQEADDAPAASFDKNHAARINDLIAASQAPVEQHTPTVWADDNPAAPVPSRSEIAAQSGPGYACPECGATFATKQGLGGHQRGHSKQRQRARRAA